MLSTLGSTTQTAFMTKLTLEVLQEMCKLNLDKRHVRDVLETITSSEFQFRPGIVQPQSRMASLYKLRLDIVKEKGVSDFDFLDDYEQAVSNLQKSHSESIALTSLFAQVGGFIIFYEPDTKTTRHE
jgi:hypothetical protein